MKRGANSSLSSAAKKVKMFEGEELHYKKNGELDMRFNSSKKYMKQLNANASLQVPKNHPQVQPDTGFRGNSLPPVYSKNRHCWELLEETSVRKKSTAGRKANPRPPSALQESAQGNIRTGRVRGKGIADEDEELHYTKSGELDMRFSSSRRYKEKMNASFTAGTSNANTSCEVESTSRGNSLPMVTRSRTQSLVVGEVTPANAVVEAEVPQQPVISRDSDSAQSPQEQTVRPKSPVVIIENDIPASVPMTKNQIPDMRTKTGRDWVEEQAKRHASLNIPVIPSWLPRQKDGTIDLNKRIVQLYLQTKQEEAPASVIPMPVYDPDRRANYYKKKLAKKGDFFRFLKKVRKETVEDPPCILLDNTGISESLPHQEIDPDLISKSSSGGTSPMSDFCDEDFRIPTYIPKLDYDTLKCTIYNKKENKLGNGAFGAVYKGKHHGEDVAIKKLFLNPISTGDKNSFVKELTILAAFGDHPNLVKLYGYTTEPATIVMELIKLGSLNTLLYFNEDSEIEAKLCDGRIKKRIACGIAFGMRQLHSVGITHGDLKPANVLITDDFNAKITDFGLSRLKVKTTSVIGSHIRDDGENVVAGTAAYMAPELIGNTRPKNLQADDKTDVYSFGILLNEIIHEEEPYVRDYDKLKGRGPFAAVDHAKSGNRPYMNTKLVGGDLFAVITAAWNTFPHLRPDFRFISRMLLNKDLVFPSLIEIPF